MKRERLYDVDRAKGLGIFLVVLGHLVLKKYPEGNAWFETLHDVIYKFHMPFFMYVSGFIMYYTFPEIKSFPEYASYVRKRFVRLMPAFFLFAIAIAVGKAVFASFIQVDNVPGNFLLSIVKIAIDPIRSHAGSLWYIYVLFIYYMIFPALLKLFRQNLAWLVAFTLALHFGYIYHVIPSTKYFALTRVMEYAFVFSVGMWIAANYGKVFELYDLYFVVLLLVFAGSFSILLLTQSHLSKLIIGFFSIPALHALVRRKPMRDSQLLLTFGKYTFAIYLMNTMAIGLTKGVILKFISWDGRNFLFVAPVILFMGVFLPIFVKRYIFPRIPWLDKITN